MAVTLFDLTVGSYTQSLEALREVMRKSREYFENEGIDLQEVVDTRLHPDMHPFSFQILAVVVHSIETLRGLESGVFDPVAPEHEPCFTGLERLVAETCERLAQYERQKLDVLEATEIRTGLQKVMTVNEYLLSHAIPNFYFHASTAYDILRMKGAPIGKLDFLGDRRITVL